MKLVFLTDVSQVRRAMKERNRRSPEMRFVTGDMAVATELERHDIPFLNEWDYLGASDVERNFQEANELAGNWWGEFGMDIKYEWYPDFETARQHFAWPFEACLNARTIYTRLLDSIEVDNISGFFLPKRGYSPYESPPAAWQILPEIQSVAQAVLIWEARRRGIRLKSLKTSKPLSVSAPPWRPRRISQRTISTCAASNYKGERLVLLLDNGLRSKEIAQLEKHFGNDPNWALMRLSAFEFNVLESLSLRGAKQEWELRLAKSWEQLKKVQYSYDGSYPEIFSNPELDFQFERVWKDFRRAAGLGEKLSTVISVLKPALIVLGHDSYLEERTIERVAHFHSIPVAALIHTGFRHILGYKGIIGDADVELVWGDADIQYLKGYGGHPRKFEAVGTLQYDADYRQFSNGVPAGRTELTTAQKRELGLPVASPLVLVLTASVNIGLASPIADVTLHRKTWIGLKELASRRPDVTFLIKPHPGWDHFQFYRSLVKRGPRNLILAEDLPLESAMKATDVALLVNYCTTAALEAMLSHIPVVYLRTAVYLIPSRVDVLMDRGVILTSSIKEFEGALGRVLHDEEYRSRVLEDAEKMLPRFLGGQDGIPTIVRMNTVFEKLAQAHETGAAYQTLSNSSAKAESMIQGSTHSLFEAGETRGFLSRWEQVSKALSWDDPGSKETTKVALLSAMFAIGATVDQGQLLSYLTKACSDQLEERLGMPAKMTREIRLQAYLSAIRRFVKEEKREATRDFVHKALMDLPLQAIRSHSFRHACVRAYFPRTRLLLMIANSLGWLKWRISSLRHTNYMTLGKL